MIKTVLKLLLKFKVKIHRSGGLEGRFLSSNNPMLYKASKGINQLLNIEINNGRTHQRPIKTPIPLLNLSKLQINLHNLLTLNHRFLFNPLQ